MSIRILKTIQLTTAMGVAGVELDDAFCISAIEPQSPAAACRWLVIGGQVLEVDGVILGR